MLIKNVDVYKDEYGKKIEKENWISHGKVLNDFKARGIIPESYKVIDFSNLLCELGILYSTYDKKCFEKNYECFCVKEEFAFLINEEYIKPSANSFKWSTKGLAWLNNFFDKRYYGDNLISILEKI
ncbi:Uncharacterised protein [[Clostridium] sordellii]|uniref:hypothetical protein n=1 Tax=Paraclostridium sordellii TaxID=1505 RepID=UPI0005E75E66|nr:hypothetical protein [Paeniclostridium sordellii]CEO10756.1 Uncharacterised protein [[Clostridium] sordellii] [Paeniclostridium sordellii]